ncbi:MAG: M48 family metalloprotease, partial [Oligoflexales bacterium]|nr:M48 family metalloprotease [Oligoflexales bacterium]
MKKRSYLNLSAKILLFCLGTVLFSGCIKKYGSSLMHTFGQTAREQKKLTCENKIGSGSIRSKETAVKRMEDYLVKHIQLITYKNSSTFNNEYASGNFCIDIKIDEEPNASASRDGVITAYQGIFRAVNEDAAFAAVISHEMAHISMGHNYFTTVHEKMAQNADYMGKVNGIENKFVESDKKAAEVDVCVQSLFELNPRYTLAMMQDINDVFSGNNRVKPGKVDFVKHIFRIYDGENTDKATRELRVGPLAKLDEEKKAAFYSNELKVLNLSNDLAKIMVEIENIKNEVYEMENSTLGTQVASNWKEAEADEVGYEFYLRAGFDPNYYTAFFKQMEEAAKKQAENSGTPQENGYSRKISLAKT